MTIPSAPLPSSVVNAAVNSVATRAAQGRAIPARLPVSYCL